ncbi:MAG: response regulator, partial [Proteobacteria bacterium]|nr:response regulator [Pseudomonadota bacterium]
MGDFSNYRILIVDDDRDFAAALSAMLIDRGHAVETAVDGAAAGEALERFAADAALIGLRPDGGDSPLEPMAEMRRRQPDMVCVMVTDFAEVDTVLEAWRAGADDCLSKPID